MIHINVNGKQFISSWTCARLFFPWHLDFLSLSPTTWNFLQSLPLFSHTMCCRVYWVYQCPKQNIKCDQNPTTSTCSTIRDDLILWRGSKREAFTRKFSTSSNSAADIRIVIPTPSAIHASGIVTLVVRGSGLQLDLPSTSYYVYVHLHYTCTPYYHSLSPWLVWHDE